MKINGKSSAKYTIAGEKGEIVVEVKLKQFEEMGKPFQNVWYAIATLNDNTFEHPDLAFCVNAQYMAEQIVSDEIKRLRAEHGTKLRVKKK